MIAEGVKRGSFPSATVKKLGDGLPNLLLKIVLSNPAEIIATNFTGTEQSNSPTPKGVPC
jgi:hypothetical protein